MALKTDIAQMATKDDLVTLQSNLQKQTKGLIAEAVGPLKTDITELRQRMDIQEKKQKAAPSASSGSSSYIPADIKIILDSLDPAHKRIVFSGFPLDMACKERTTHIEKFLAKFPSVPKYISVGVIPKGPKNNRSATKMSFVEFCSSDDAYSALKVLKSEKLEFGSVSITIKGALTKVNGTRNYSLGAAERMIRATPDVKADGIKIDWKTRKIEYGGEEVFCQQQNELKGTFMGAFSHLVLP
jgi:hypothetical protein